MTTLPHHFSTDELITLGLASDDPMIKELASKFDTYRDEMQTKIGAIVEQIDEAQKGIDDASSDLDKVMEELEKNDV